MNKLTNDKGQVAVLISNGFGAGWSTWNSDNPDMVFDKDIARAVSKKMSYQRIRTIADDKYPDACMLGLDDLEIVWVDKGRKFRIDEYDGAESIVYLDKEQYLEA